MFGEHRRAECDQVEFQGKRILVGLFGVTELEVHVVSQCRTHAEGKQNKADKTAWPVRN